ncbi:MAG: glycosyltransferase family 39 protein [Candidatus Caccosoma sp.]|nr:glycosyltransferase family 39 protein [Candidatus Caccosoma sp.]
MMKERFYKIIYYLIPTLLVLLALCGIFTSSMWADEVFTVELLSHPFKEIIKIAILDVHPPLYYLIYLFFYKIFGFIFNYDIVYVGKLVSIMPFIILLIINLTYTNKKYGKNISFIFNLLICGMPHMMQYALELRMYSYALLFVTITFLISLSIKENSGNYLKWFLLTIFSTLALYTHYFAGLACVIIFIELLIHFIKVKNIKSIINVFLFGIMIVAFFSPWLIVFIKQVIKVNKSYWILPITFVDIIKCLSIFFTYNSITSSILSFSLITLAIIGIYKLKNKNEILSGIFVYLFTFIVGIFISLFIKPILVPRYLIVTAGCFYFSLAFGINKIISDFNYRKISKLTYILLVLIALFTNTYCLAYKYKNTIVTNNTLNCLNEIIKDEDTIVYDDFHLSLIISHYYNDCKNYAYTDEYVTPFTECFDNCNIKRLYDIDSLKYISKEFYYITKKEIILLELNHNYKICKINNYNMDIYSFIMYRVSMN